ncbi:unnamed protein product, partial [marine sediment metagenome]|uniref:Uncharacterized protein n=1 Tax=marine sediment metagenome TaxID=412755 RepID=X1REM1_9ZZZZ
MTTEKQVPEPELKPEPKLIKPKRSFTVCGCKVEVVEDAEGKAHFEAACLSKEAREELASILEQEAILRVNPKVILED